MNRLRRQTINRYENSTPRAAFGLAAIAMTAITIGLFVVVPATTEPGNSAAVTVAAAKTGSPVLY